MGVHGLWRLIESSGKPVPLETLENKVLAVDISIWLHQAIKGFQDARGAGVPNAHLLGVYHRLCKLLYYRIRPVFVFDGGVPFLKRQTIIKRNQLKYQHEDESERLHQEILNTLLKQSAIDSVLIENLTQSTKKSPVKISRKDNENKDDMFILPELPKEFSSTQDSSESDVEDVRPHKHWIDIDTFDEKNEKFLSLPADVRHDILTDIKENNKRTSWKKLYVTPAENGEFSKFQIQRVLKRRSLQLSLEEAEKEMGGHSLSLGDLEALLCQEGIVTASKIAAKRRIASDDNTRFLFIKNIQKAKEEITEKLKDNKERTENLSNPELEPDLQTAIELSKYEIKKLEVINEEVENIAETENVCNNPYTSLEPLSNFKFESDTKKVPKSEMLEEAQDSSSVVNIKNTKISGFESDLEKAIKMSKNESNLLESLSNQPSTSSITQIESETFDSHQIKLPNSQDSSTTVSSKIGKTSEFESDLEKAIKLSENESNLLESVSNKPSTSSDFQKQICDTDLEAAIKLSLETEPEQKFQDNMSYLNNFQDGDFVFESSSDDEIKLTPVAKGSTSLAKAYLTEYSDLTPFEIEKFLSKDYEPKEVKSKDFYLNEMILNTPKKVKSKEKDVQDLIQDLTSDPEDLEGVGVISDSNDSDDFVEVDNHSTDLKPVLEVVIKPENPVVDDLFADVFQPNEDQSPFSTVVEKDTAATENKGKILDKFSNSVQENEEVNSKQNDIQAGNNDDVLTTNKETSDIENSFKVPEEKKENLNTRPKISKEELINLKENLEAERDKLLKEKAHEDRMSHSITDQMYKDTQDLLQLFGVPYIIAPKEAEAQCAFLDDINLTDGTITDDSDIWLFGGKTVYKNFFNHKKHVLEFRSENIQHHFKMSRQQFILLALLVGSDYTLGIQGIGPVTALEILAAFPPSKQETVLTQDELVSGLQQFKNWWQSGRIAGPGKTSLRNKLKNITLLDGFPSTQVVEAYLKPEVDLSKETFSWGKPNVEKLREFARTKFGWSDLKCTEILMPVMKRWENPKSQKSILAYFNKRPLNNTEISLSKRVKKAVNRLGMENSDSEDEKVVASTSSKGKSTNSKKEPKKKRAVKKRKPDEPEVVTLDVDIKPLNKLQEKLTKFEKSEPKKYEEFIPQREKDRINALKTKLRAIELYRKSSSGPGFVKKRAKPPRKVKDEAELSENSDDGN